jgi:hypothetical protein
MRRLFRAAFGRDLFRACEGRTGGAKNECRAMWNNADAIIRAQLSPNEQLLWSAQPRGGVAFRNEDFFLIPFSVMWGGFAFYWEWSVTAGGGPLFARLWGIPFVAVGLYDAWQCSNRFYGLTTERALIARRSFGESVRSIELKTLGDVTLSVGNDRSGTITLGNDTPASAWAGLTPWNRSSYVSAPRFERIERANDVYNQVRDAQRAAQSS